MHAGRKRISFMLDTRANNYMRTCTHTCTHACMCSCTHIHSAMSAPGRVQCWISRYSLPNQPKGGPPFGEKPPGLGFLQDIGDKWQTDEEIHMPQHAWGPRKMPRPLKSCVDRPNPPDCEPGSRGLLEVQSMNICCPEMNASHA